MKVDTLISGGGGPARVILMVDVSSSMCFDQFENVQNDPKDARIIAARNFIDSLAANRPASEVGLVIFGSGVSSSLYPLSLSVPENVTRLKNRLYYASCKWKASSNYPADGPLAAEKAPGLRKATAIKATGLGISLDSALTIIDDSLDLKPQFLSSRHVVILTDGGWDDFSAIPPDTVRTRYALKSPGRPFPMIHGVYMTASGSPPTRPELSQITTETGGLFFGNVTPETISARLLEILDIIVTTPFAHVLQGLRITNLNSGVSANAISVSLSDPIENSYEVVLPAIPLPIGENVLLISRSIFNPKTAPG